MSDETRTPVCLRDQLRDASGDFACPVCFDEWEQRVNPMMDECPMCGTRLEWPDESIAAWAHHRRARKVSAP